MIQKYVRAANYLSAIQIYLHDNVTLHRPLQSDDIKSRLLGHWGTCPGINFMYAHLNQLIITRDVRMMFVLGPGHGFPALQANLFLEGTLARYYNQAQHTEKGITYIAKNFSWPYGFPSHSNPGAPGVILEGGELGYSLSTAWGAVLDNPDLLVACMIGDGEAETGPLATSWHISKFIDPKKDGVVLPILHLNGYKISGPSIFGRMKDSELRSLFEGYGYQPFFVDGNDEELYERMPVVLEQCLDAIQSIKKEGKSGGDSFVRFPMIVLRTPKGWTGVKELHGQKIEGNSLSHQVVCPQAKTDYEERALLETWLRSYHFEELFDPQTGFSEDIHTYIPSPDRAMGNNPHTFGMKYVGTDLVLPAPEVFMEDVPTQGIMGSSSMTRMGLYMEDVFRKNENNFLLMSPDETYSNKLDHVFNTTSRAFNGPIETWDKDLGSNGRVIEMLSEHTLQGMLQGYVLTGRHGIFASYEAFVQVVSSMADQYAKFLRIARDIDWRGDVASFNYILTSSGWRQEHNGFSHQNPGFIDSMLQKQGDFVRVYFPPDGNTALLVLDKCLSTKNQVHVIVAGKTVEPRWLDASLARQELDRGLMVWDFASDEDPHLIFSAAGEYLTKEALAAIMLVKKHFPQARLRFVSILEISSFGLGSATSQTQNVFAECYPDGVPVIFNFHGYPETLKQLLFDKQTPASRFYVHGYTENGSTTTPFDLHLRNGTSRYDLCVEACRILQEKGVINAQSAEECIREYMERIQKHREYITEYGVDPADISDWVWSRS